MRHNAEQALDDILSQHPELRIQWNQHRKLPNDPRVIPWVGHLLRRTSLDELPQLWNVLKGEMSIVGPRPLPPYHLADFDAHFLDRRMKVTPGITGLWQIHGRGNGHPDMFVKWDNHYIDNWSLWLDFKILAQTPSAVVRGSGAS